MSKLYVGNLPYTMTSDDLADAFAQFGEVKDAVIVMDRETGRSKGFGFVTMDSEEAANKALEGMHNTQLEGRTIKVDRARPPERSGGGGGFGGPRGGGRGGDRGGSRYDR